MQKLIDDSFLSGNTQMDIVIHEHDAWQREKLSEHRIGGCRMSDIMVLDQNSSNQKER